MFAIFLAKEKDAIGVGVLPNKVLPNEVSPNEVLPNKKFRNKNKKVLTNKKQGTFAPSTKNNQFWSSSPHPQKTRFALILY